MRFKSLPIGVIVILAANAVALAQPLPDVVLYGSVTLDGRTVRADDDVTLIARVDGVAEPVGSYHMGDIPGAGDHYVLRLRLESQVEGESQSDNAARVGQTVHIFVQRGEEPERHVTDFVISAQGHIQQLDLADRMLGDWNRDTRIALDDFVQFHACMEGPTESTSSQCLAVFDFDDSGQVDLEDFSALQSVFTGS